jgi:hypothetical protein
VKLSLIIVSLFVLSALSAGAARAEFKEWKHSGSIFVLTTPEGADLPASTEVREFPLLVRLQRDFFDFGQAKADGSDLRFADVASKSLAYQIDEWNPAAGVASIWVRVPVIQGNSRQEIKVYWGNSPVKSESNGKAVFNDSNGYVSVWHLHDEVLDEVGTLTSEDKGTTSAAGIIGTARHFPGGKGVFCGDKIPNSPSGAGSHSTEAWFRAEKPNTTLIGWGNEGGGRGSKVRMLFRSPPHIRIDSDFSDVRTGSDLALNKWTHVIHTYDRQDGKIYINGQLAGAAKPLLDIKSPARCWLGGWYHQYDFVGDLDEVRVSKVARSADWIRLQYENQKPLQTLVGPLVQPGSEFSTSAAELTVREGDTVRLTAQAGGAQKLYWRLKQAGQETTVGVDRLSFSFTAPRIVGDQTATLQLKAIYGDKVKTKDISIQIKEALPEPAFTLVAPAEWDGRQPLEIAPQITNQAELKAQGAEKLNYVWSVSGLAVGQDVQSEKLLLKRALNSGTLTIVLTIDNGGIPVSQTAKIRVREPLHEPWLVRTPDKNEKPLEGQFYARDDKNEGTLHYNGVLSDPAEVVILQLFANEKLVGVAHQAPAKDKSYALSLKLKPGLIKYKVELRSRVGSEEKLLDTVSNLVCGDAYIIEGQSNAEATDVGKEDPADSSEWIRTFGSPSGGSEARSTQWTNAVVRSRNGGKGQIGAWGMVLAQRLLESQKMPICIINGAVGGTRVDQHLRNDADPTNQGSIYGRLLWRVREARLTHGVRAVLWHQGESDQGADGPTGGFGYETYERDFIAMTADWQADYPNIQHYYTFQIWPKACAMGVNGSDNRLREVQRRMPEQYSHLSVMSTLGIKPPGGCHYPLAGYAEFANLIGPLVERDQYGAKFTQSITAPNLRRAYFTGEKRDEIALEFDQEVTWNDPLASQFHVSGEPKQVDSGAATGNVVKLSLKSPAKGDKVSYLDSANWSPEHLLYGANGIAALTFWEVPIEAARK